jgi:hypothetical protein
LIAIGMIIFGSVAWFLMGAKHESAADKQAIHA